MIFYPSVLGIIERPLEDFLVGIHNFTGLSWAWSIILLTVIVRIVIFPITAKQTQSTLAMQRLSPYIKQLQQKYKDDRGAMNQAMMEFYRDNRVNPLSSCLPILIQIPIFMALFFVLKDFTAPAGTSTNFSFLGPFITDITEDVKNVGFQGWILVAVYVASQVLSSVTMMTTPDPMQKWMFRLMPFFFVPFIINFPVGVMLYWITTNIWSLGQYLLVVKFTKSDREVVLPADSKGRKKKVQPKNSKGKKQDTSGSSSKVNKGNQARSKPRKNKRRR